MDFTSLYTNALGLIKHLLVIDQVFNAIMTASFFHQRFVACKIKRKSSRCLKPHLYIIGSHIPWK
jgi:hypothetical protein